MEEDNSVVAPFDFAQGSTPAFGTANSLIAEEAVQ
jgi:hypothetical protein